MSAVMAIAAIGSLVLSAYGTYKQKQENERVTGLQMGMRSEDIARDEKWRNIEYGIAKKDRALQREENERAWKWKEEERDYMMAQNAIGSMTSFLDRNPTYKSNFINIWDRQRRAA